MGDRPSEAVEAGRAWATPRAYRIGHAAVFCRTRERWGCLSNMAAGFPLRYAGLSFPSSESLYQSLRFRPHEPHLALVVGQLPSGMAKERAHASAASTRSDWLDDAALSAMRFAVRMKADQHDSVRETLLATGEADIVELSTRGDDYWGAVRTGDAGVLVGRNVLGRILMETRDDIVRGIMPDPALPAIFGLPTPL